MRVRGKGLLILHLHFKKSEHFYIPRLKINKSECWTFNSLVRDNVRLEYVLTTRLKMYVKIC